MVWAVADEADCACVGFSILSETQSRPFVMERKSSLISAPQPLVSGLGVQGLAPTTRCKRNMVEGDGRTPAPADFTLGDGDDYLSAGRAFIDGNGVMTTMAIFS